MKPQGITGRFYDKDILFVTVLYALQTLKGNTLLRQDRAKRLVSTNGNMCI